MQYIQSIILQYDWQTSLECVYHEIFSKYKPKKKRYIYPSLDRIADVEAHFKAAVTGRLHAVWMSQTKENRRDRNTEISLLLALKSKNLAMSEIFGRPSQSVAAAVTFVNQPTSRKVV